MAIDLKLDKSTNNYAVIGNPVTHSKSPLIHTLFAKQTGIELDYQAIEVPTNSFNDYIKAFFSQSGKGLNITVPFKEEAYSICTNLTERAQYAASVNTLWCDKDLNIFGDTTDGQGLLNDLTINNKIDLEKKSILILGAGGTVKSILLPLCEQNPASIVIANRTVERAVQLAEKFSGKINIKASSYTELFDHKFDLIINGTSSSLMGDLPPIPDNILNEHACCYDLMYADTATVFMQWAEKQGAATILDGLGMLVEQAAESFAIWHGVKPDASTVVLKLRN